MNYFRYETVIGPIGIKEENDAITEVYIREETMPKDLPLRETPLIQEAGKQLNQYLAGQREEFDLPLAPQGTEFMQEVWNELCSIPYGETRTYQQIAQAIGRPKACRAVGNANNRNPIAIFIPCHRVIGANGKLVGYAGGLEMKKKLLEIEMSNNS